MATETSISAILGTCGGKGGNARPALDRSHSVKADETVVRIAQACVAVRSCELPPGGARVRISSRMGRSTLAARAGSQHCT